MRWCFFSPGYRSKKVLCGDTRTSGGAEAQVAYLARALSRLGNEVILIYGDGRSQERKETIDGVTCIDAAPSWRKPGSILRFWRTLSAISPDIMYARLPSDFLGMIGLFARRRGLHFMYALANDRHCSTWTSYNYHRWFHCPLYALGLISANAIAVQHEGQKHLLNPVLRSRTFRVPNLVSEIASEPRDLSKAIYDAVWIAQIRPVKQLGLYLDLAAALPDHQFAVVGGQDPMTSPDVFKMLEERMLKQKNLKFFGALRAEEVRGVLAQSKVLVNTSQAEGFPNTMLEAWSLGVPVVSLLVDPGGVISREQLGFVSRSPANLVRDVSSLAGTTSLNQEYGSNGLYYVRKHHSLTAFCEALALAAPGSELPSNVTTLLSKPTEAV